jgi:hypothetical protein
MKKLMMLAVAAIFSVSTAAYACDGKDHQQATKSEKAAKVAKKDAPAKTAPKDQKKS